MRFQGPALLTGEYDLDQFDCGRASLNVWLKDTAMKSSTGDNAKTYVVAEPETSRVVAYSCLSAGSVSRASARGRLSRNAPDPIPTVVVGRLAVDLRFQGLGLGGLMLVDAMTRAVQASEVLGARAITVNPIDDAARGFYEHHAFRELSDEKNSLFLIMKETRISLGLDDAR